VSIIILKFKKLEVFVANAARLLTMKIIYVNAVDVITKVVLMKDGRNCITMKCFLVIFVETEHVCENYGPFSREQLLKIKKLLT
jgi:hypothetical protein